MAHSKSPKFWSMITCQWSAGQAPFNNYPLIFNNYPLPSDAIFGWEISVVSGMYPLWRYHFYQKAAWKRKNLHEEVNSKRTGSLSSPEAQRPGLFNKNSISLYSLVEIALRVNEMVFIIVKFFMHVRCYLGTFGYVFCFWNTSMLWEATNLEWKEHQAISQSFDFNASLSDDK